MKKFRKLKLMDEERKVKLEEYACKYNRENRLRWVGEAGSKKRKAFNLKLKKRREAKKRKMEKNQLTATQMKWELLLKEL